MAEANSSMRKPVFAKVDQRRPGTKGHNLTVKVVSSNMVIQKRRPDGPQVRQMRMVSAWLEMKLGQFYLPQGMTKRNGEKHNSPARITECKRRIMRFELGFYGDFETGLVRWSFLAVQSLGVGSFCFISPPGCLA